MAINATRLSNEIRDLLLSYSTEVQNEIDTSAVAVANELVKELKSARKFKNQSTHYYKGWRVSKVGKRKIAYVVHNKTDYQLTHLLEKGHALRNGGRTQAFPHIGPSEQKAVADFLERVERAVRQ